MKVKGKELILKVTSLVATILTFLGLAFKFAVEKQTMGSISHSESITRSQWVDSFDMAKELTSAGHTFWQIARIFMIISLIVIAVLAVITVVEFFFNHKYLSLAKFIISIVAIACVVIFFAALVIGGILFANKASDLIPGGSLSFIPHVGPFFMLIFGLIASITALLDKKKA